MKLRLLSLVLALLLLCGSFVACGKKEITSLVITEGLPAQYELNAVPDFSAVKATVTYSNGKTLEVNAEDLSFSKLDTSSAGIKKLTVSYKGFSVKIEIEVKAAPPSSSTTPDSSLPPAVGGNVGEDVKLDYEIMGVQLSPALVARETAAYRFKVNDAVYTVGNANPFTYRLRLETLKDGEESLTNMTKYVSSSTVHLVEGNEETLADSAYVSIDEQNNTFQFTKDAAGKTFRITTRPLYGVQGIEEKCTRSLLVKVVDGYNVTLSKELNLLTNAPATMHEGYKTEAERALPENKQNAIAKAFVDEQLGEDYYDTYGGDALSALVLHNDLNPGVNDIPAAYVVTSTVDGSLGFDNNFGIYARAASTPFYVYGNYFTVNTSALPLMSNDPAIVGDQASSTTSVFSIGNSTLLDAATDEERMTFDHTAYTATVSCLALRGVNANETVSQASPKRTHTPNAFAFTYLDATLDNCVVESYTVSAAVSNSNTRLQVLNCTMNNAWQTHVLAHAHNQLQAAMTDTEQYQNATTWEHHLPLAVDIRSSTLTKCGGAVILAQLENSAAYNKDAGLQLTVDKSSTLWSYVTGEETWFALAGKTAALSDIKDFGVALQENATSYGIRASLFTTQEQSGATRLMNVVFLATSGSCSYTVIEDSETKRPLLNNADAAVADFIAANAAKPLFCFESGQTATFIDGDGLLGNADMSSFVPSQAINAFSGDHLALYTAGMSLVMGYYHY